MRQWRKQKAEPLERIAIGSVVEIHYMDAHNVMRYAYGGNGAPFGVFAVGVDGSKLGGHERNAIGSVTTAVPYGRIVRWRYK